MTTLLSSAIRNVSLMAFALQVISSSNAIGQEPAPTITVTGEAESHINADRVVIQASIESRAKSAADACKDNREKSRELLEYLKLQSIEEALISSELLSISPIYPPAGKGGGYSESESDPFEGRELGPTRSLLGYRATRNFNIIVTDLKKFEAIYQGIVEKGVNRVDSVTYRSSQEKVHKEKLRLEAVRAAKDRAQAMAQELGATLSSIKTIGKSISSSMNRGPRGYGGGMGMGMGDPFDTNESSWTTQQITLQSSLEVVFYLGNTELKEKE